MTTTLAVPTTASFSTESPLLRPRRLSNVSTVSSMDPLSRSTSASPALSHDAASPIGKPRKTRTSEKKPPVLYTTLAGHNLH